MSRAPDWARFVRRHWEKTPARLSLGQPLIPPEQAFQAVVAASGPFRFGTRFGTLPDVRFFVGEAQLRAPGELLPNEEDRNVGAYVRRVAAARGREKFQLLVEQPLLLDFALWDGVRGFVRGLLERVGVPVLPIVSEVFLGNFARAPHGAVRRPHHAVFTLVLQGGLKVRHLPEATPLEARAGDVLYTPSGFSQLEACRGSCLALRLWLPVRGARPSEAVKDVLVRLLERRLPEADEVPFLDYPGRRPRAGAATSIEPLERVASGLEALTHGEDLQQALRVIWTRRVSACGLEPAPPPREHPPLEDAHLVRQAPNTHVVRMPVGAGQWIGAANGHAFPLHGHDEVAQVLQSMESGATLQVGELCRRARRGSRREALRTLLETLHALRAIDIVSEARG